MSIIPFIHSRSQKISAQSGCVIYCLHRKKPNIFFGMHKFKKKYHEEWVQLSLDHMYVEVHLDHDNAINLSNSLQGAVTARLIVKIDSGDLEVSLPKVINKFMCTTASDKDVVLGDRYFVPKIRNMLLEAVYEVVKKADYLKLIEDPKHKDELQENLRDIMHHELAESGFALVNCTIPRFVPLNPRTLGGESPIVTTWINWNRQEYQLQEQIDNEERHRAIARDKKIKEEEIEKLLQEKEIELQVEEKQKNQEIRAEEIRKVQEIRLQTIQRDKEKKIEEIKTETRTFYIKQKVDQERLEIESQYLIEAIKFEEYEKIRKEKENNRINISVQEQNILEQEKKKAEIQAEIMRIKGQAQADVIKARIEAESFSEIMILNKILTNLPEILKNMRVPERVGDTMMVHLDSDDASRMNGFNNVSLAGLAYLPMIREIIAILFEKSRSSSAPEDDHRSQLVEIKPISTYDLKSDG